MNLSSRSSTPPRKSILVVDDDEGTRSAIYEVFSPEYRVILAVDGLDGYEKANEPPPPDLIIADIAMPRLDGLTMARRIREHDVLRRVPIVFMAAHMPLASVLAVSYVDPFSCLPKPTDLDVLEKAVRRLLN
jgi:two-component system, OmpR family, response regulator MprA